MNTGSTASSGTEGPDPQDSSEATEATEARSPADSNGPAAVPDGPETAAADAAEHDAAEHDATRRAFFFQFGKEAVTAVGQVAGMAGIVGRTSSGLASELLGLEEPAAAAAEPAFTRSDGGSSAVVSAAPPAAEDSFHSAYRLVGDELVLLDQRGMPDALDEVAARRGSDVAYYLRLGVARGGPLLAQVAAYGLALTAAERAAHLSQDRGVELRRTMRALVEARPSSRLLAWSVERMEAALADLIASGDGDGIAAAARAEADAIASDFQTWHAAIASTLAAHLRDLGDEQLTVLVHGDQGALSGGAVGTGLLALRRLRDEGQQLRVFVTEGRPFMDGARVTSWELRQAGIDHKIIPDAAVAWLFEREPIDVVLLAADWVAADGDIGALLGSRAIAQLAYASSGPRPHVIVSGVGATRDASTPDGASIPVELRPARDLVAYLTNVPVRASDALVPATDVVPAAAVGAMVSEHGVIAAGEAG
jgi:methylthioribose-1-phosphate isomerase